MLLHLSGSSDTSYDWFHVIFVWICVLNLSFVLQVLQGYVVTAVAWLYWSRYVSSLLLSWGRYISSLLTRAPSKKPKEDTGASLKRLMGYMRPYLQRFVVVLFLVVLSSYGKWGNTLDLTTKLWSYFLQFLLCCLQPHSQSRSCQVKVQNCEAWKDYTQHVFHLQIVR